MIRSTSFRTEIEMTRWMNAQGLDISDLYVLWMNASNFWTVFYEDGLGRDIIDTTAGAAGVAYGTGTGVGVAGAIIPVGALRLTTTAEALGAPDPTTGVLSGTLSNTYVIPDSVVLTGTSGFVVKDDGFGALVDSETGKLVGAVDYAAGTFTARWPFGGIPATVSADYLYSSLPDTDNVPTRARLSALSVLRTSGAAATVGWAVFNDAACALPPVAMGNITLSGTGAGTANLINVVSNVLDVANRDGRWVKLFPNVGPNDFTVTLTWERIL